MKKYNMKDTGKEKKISYKTPTLKKVGKVADLTHGATTAVKDSTLVGSQ